MVWGVPTDKIQKIFCGDTRRIRFSGLFKEIQELRTITIPSLTVPGLSFFNSSNSKSDIRLS